MRSLLHKFTFKKIVILLGDNGAKVLVYDWRLVVESLSIDAIANKEQAQLLRNLFIKYQGLPIYLVLNVSEQSFEVVSVPTANPLVFNKLMQRKIAFDRGKESLKGYYKIAGSNKRKNTTCVLVDVPVISPLKEWLEFLGDNAFNIVRGIYIFPLEMRNIAYDIREFLYGKSKVAQLITKVKERKNKWLFYVFQSETSGIRFVITKNGDLVFTRLLHYHYTNEALSQEKISLIKAEIVGTIEYLKRLDFEASDSMDIYLLVSKQFMMFLGVVDNINYRFIHIDLEKFGRFKFERQAKVNYEVESDRLFMRYFLLRGCYHGFITKRLKLAANLFNANALTNIVFGAVIIAVLTISIILAQRSHMLSKALAQTTIIKNQHAKELEVIRQAKFGFNIDEDKVMDVALLHNQLVKDSADPINMIFKLYDLVPSNVKINDINFEEYKDAQIRLVINADFRSDNLSFEQIFMKYDVFLRSIKSSFTQYNIGHSELPNTLSFGSSNESLPVSIQITGPVK
jgi:hypothetical protein